MGPDLMEQMRSQAERFGAELRTEDVERIDLSGEVKTVVANGVEHKARAVILAMGAAARYLGVPGEETLRGRGVSACATCDGFFFRDQDIAVIGGGDSAMEEATFLTRFAKSVTIIHRREEFRASKIMLERARANDKIKWLTNKFDDLALEVPGDRCGERGFGLAVELGDGGDNFVEVGRSKGQSAQDHPEPVRRSGGGGWAKPPKNGAGRVGFSTGTPLLGWLPRSDQWEVITARTQRPSCRHASRPIGGCWSVSCLPSSSWV
ncbi:NAD(P)/FAD-dependent oxidoreductase [Saccharopolyspora tripterygii]